MEIGVWGKTIAPLARQMGGTEHADLAEWYKTKKGNQKSSKKRKGDKVGKGIWEFSTLSKRPLLEKF